VPVNSTGGYWGITMDNVKIGNTPFLSKPSRAIVDTGTSLISFPKELALEVAKSYNAIDNNGTFTISRLLYIHIFFAMTNVFTSCYEKKTDCNENELSPLLFDIGGTEFTVPSDALIYTRDADGCTAGFTYSTDDFTILGDAFMKNYYFIFNIAVPQIQIAPLK
jgi:hypothetical protein